MAPFPHMRFPQGWTAYDEENGAVVMLIKNLLDHPTDPDGEPFWFPNWTRLVYAGDNRGPRRRTSTTRAATPPAWSARGWPPAGSSPPTRSRARSTADGRLRPA